jgi:hypothetical protein
MPTDFLTLLHRDHHDLECGLEELLASGSLEELRGALDGVRLGLVAHAEAEDIVLYHAWIRDNTSRALAALVEDAHAAHGAQERALSSLVCVTPWTSEWFATARSLRDLVHDHAEIEENRLLPAIREVMPRVYDTLAGEFATERLRQLAMLQPSAPIYVSELAAS